MSTLLHSIDKRTQLVGENRLELLMFRLTGRQLFALNVFKIREVIPVPKVTQLPQSHPVVCGVAYLRDRTIPVIDLSAAIGRPAITDKNQGNLIVTEYNRSIQAFLVGSVDRIVNLNWNSIEAPPSGTGRAHFLTAITKLEEDIIEILDVERVLAEVSPYDTSVSEGVLDGDLADKVREMGLRVLLVDDSSTALNQIKRTVLHLGVEVELARDGMQALAMLQKWAAEDVDKLNSLAMVITDAEMPEMDGYRLTHEIRQDPNLAKLYVVLHTSLSGSFNQAMVKKVGCDDFLSKFQSDELAAMVQDRLRTLL